jgi:hypothetical protein
MFTSPNCALIYGAFIPEEPFHAEAGTAFFISTAPPARLSVGEQCRRDLLYPSIIVEPAL